MTSRLEIWAATPTPMDQTGALYLGGLDEIGSQLQRSGVTGIFVAGTTGEFASLQVSEREELVDRWASARPAGLQMGVHVGATELGTAQRLAAHAERSGAEMIAAVAPYFGESTSLERTVAFLADVAAAAPRTPFAYYHIPSMTGSTRRPSELLELAQQRIPTLAAVKFTDSDFGELDAVRESVPEIHIYFGRDELLPAALGMGVHRVIGSLYNLLAPVAHKVAEALWAGDSTAAVRLHAPFREIARVSSRFGGLGFIKQLLDDSNFPYGPARLPWGPLDARAREASTQLAVRLAEVTGGSRLEEEGAYSKHRAAPERRGSEPTT